MIYGFIFFIALLSVDVSLADGNYGPMMCAKLFGNVSTTIVSDLAKDFQQKHPFRPDMDRDAEKSYLARNVYDTEWVQLEIPLWIDALKKRQAELKTGFQKILDVAANSASLHTAVGENGVIVSAADKSFEIVEGNFVPREINTFIGKLEAAQTNKKLSLRLFFAYSDVVAEILNASSVTSRLANENFMNEGVFLMFLKLRAGPAVASKEKIQLVYRKLGMYSYSFADHGSALKLPTLHSLSPSDIEYLKTSVVSGEEIPH